METEQRPGDEQTLNREIRMSEQVAYAENAERTDAAMCRRAEAQLRPILDEYKTLGENNRTADFISRMVGEALRQIEATERQHEHIAADEGERVHADMILDAQRKLGKEGLDRLQEVRDTQGPEAADTLLNSLLNEGEKNTPESQWVGKDK